MRAEMTVGLDLKSLENLRIFNGYEKEKNARRLSLEAPSSPESDVNHQDSNSSQCGHHKPKCGRPANPVPRHKRDSHIKAEYKRRDKIQKGFDMLISLVPELSEVSGKESKSAMLFKTAEHCRRLDSERGNKQKELAALHQELEGLGTEIQALQDKLPCHGVETVNENGADVSMDMLYDQYVQEETKKNWKFWIFGYFMRPLYESYRRTTEDKQNEKEFESSVLQWVQNALSLTNLRKGFLDALRRISRYTSIMTSPEKLETESETRITEHCMSNVGEQGSGSAPVTTPTEAPCTQTPAPVSAGHTQAKTLAPVSSAGHTPATTPATSPPRTPNVSRRSVKRETQRATESRSRSNSPEELRIKRRSSYRSRSGKRSPGSSLKEERDVKGEYSTMSSGPNMPLLSHLLTAPQSTFVSQREPIAMVTSTDITTTSPARASNVKHQVDAGVVSSGISNQNWSSAAARNSFHGYKTSENEMLTSFIESLFSGNSKNSLTTPNTLAGMESKPVDSIAVSSAFGANRLGYHANTQQVNPTNLSNEIDIPVFSSTEAVNSFVPLSASGIISNNTVLHAGTSVSSRADMLPMEVSTPTESNSDLLLNNLQMFDSTHQVAMTTLHQTNQSVTSSGINCTARSEILNTDEDSLTCSLGLDVLDVNSVMTFFSDDKT